MFSHFKTVRKFDWQSDRIIAVACTGLTCNSLSGNNFFLPFAGTKTNLMTWSRWLYAADSSVVETPEPRLCGTDVAGSVLELFERRDASSGVRCEQVADALRQYGPVADHTACQIFEQRVQSSVTLHWHRVVHAGKVGISVTIQSHLHASTDHTVSLLCWNLGLDYLFPADSLDLSSVTYKQQASENRIGLCKSKTVS